MIDWNVLAERFHGSYTATGKSWAPQRLCIDVWGIELVDELLRVDLDALWHLVEDIGGPMYPTTLLGRLRVLLAQRRTESEGAITDREVGGGVEAASLPELRRRAASQRQAFIECVTMCNANCTDPTAWFNPFTQESCETCYVGGTCNLLAECRPCLKTACANELGACR